MGFPAAPLSAHTKSTCCPWDARPVSSPVPQRLGRFCKPKPVDPGVWEPKGPAERATREPYLLLMKPNVTGSLALLDGVAQHSVSTTLRLLFCL